MTIGKSHLTYFIGETVNEENESVKENVSLARRLARAACKREKKIRVIPDEVFRASNFLTTDAENEVDEAWDLVSGSR